jgi:drug/metabolite transporter (DMT)-like permease
MAYTSLAGIIVLTPLLPWIWVTPATPTAWALMVTMGFFGALSQWLVVLAHHRAPAAVLAPFGYIQITWTTALGFLIFGDVPDLSTLFGGAIVIGSGLYLWHRERAKRAEH